MSSVSSSPALPVKNLDLPIVQKADFVAATNKKLSDIKIELVRLSDRVARFGGKAKADGEIKLTAAREAWAQTMARLGQVESGTETAWNDMKHNVQESRDGLKESFEQSRPWLREPTEPRHPAGESLVAQQFLVRKMQGTFGGVKTGNLGDTN